MVVHRPERSDVDGALSRMWASDVRRHARSGDWILTRSYSLTGDVITVLTGGQDVSHASIYDAERRTVIEALAPEVREVPLDDLIQRNHYLIVLRPNGLDEEQGLAAVARARSVVGAEFDGLGMLGLDTETSFYCSELVVWASRLSLPTGAVVTPAELMRFGSVVYYSGRRDDPDVQAAALRAERPARVASVR
jgi:hypothetical protein